MRLISIIILLIIYFFSFDLGFTQESIKTYGFENDITMSGVISSNNKYFDVPENTIIKDARLNLVFTKSELLDVDYSTITIFINDTPIHSKRLNGEKEYKKEIVVDIPKDLIKKGYNEIEVKAYKTISDMVCRDDSNTANWLVIHKESNIKILYDYKSTSNLISDYENTFLRLDDANKIQTTVLLPNNYTNDELTSGMIISSDFGDKIKHKDTYFDFKLYSDFKERDKNKNIIYIGNKSNTPKHILDILNESEKEKLSESCIIKQVHSIYNKNKKMIVIISNKGELLIKASKVISSEKLISNLNQDSIIISKDTDVDDIDNYKNNNIIHFSELGYDNLNLKGPFTQEAILDINIPKNKELTENTKINLNMRYAENLDFERSLVSVYINNIPIGSKKLLKENANNDTLQLNFPKEVLGKNYYQIKIVFNLELKDLACVTRDTDNPFAYISNSSFIQFDYDDNNNLNFKNYPYPFVQNDRFNDLVVVVPNKLTSNELTQIGNIMFYIGKDIKYNNGSVKFINSEDLTVKDKKSNLIIIGTPKNNDFIQEINKNLNLKFNKDYSGFESNEKIKFIGNYSSELASIQLIQSPYNKEKNIMVVASSNMDLLGISSKYLTQSKFVKSLKGDVITIDEFGNIQDLNYETEKENEHNDAIETKKLKVEIKNFLIVALVLLSLVITSTILLALKYKR